MTTASNTGWTSVGEPEMTRKISLVAVCCCSVSVRSWFLASSSRKSRTFWIAITAWSAKVPRSAIWVSEKARGVPQRWTVIAPIETPSRTIGTESRVRRPTVSRRASSR